jgi:hypothetical protein
VVKIPFFLGHCYLCNLCVYTYGFMFCFLNWVCWARGNFSGELGHVRIVCVSPRCVECRAGTSIFCHFVDVGGGTVWIFYFPWLRFGVYGTIEQVGVAGQYGFLVSRLCFGGYSTMEMVGRGCCVSLFTFLSLLSVPLAGGYAR